MKREHMPLRYMGNFKAIAMDYEYFLSLSDEGQLYCLSDRQIYILLAQLDYVGWLTRWYNTEDITQKTVEFIKSDLMEALMSCVDVSVLVDQGKLTLTKDVQNQQIQSAALRQVYADRYDGTPTSINPDAPTTDFGSTGDRYDALCAALMAYVYQFASGQTSAVIAGDIAAFALLAGAAVLLIPGLNIFYAAGAALALLAGGGIIGLTTGAAVDALTDTEALDDVVCYMRETLKAESVTEANFAACLDTYPFSVGSNAAIVADFLKPTLGTNYLAFLDMLGQSYNGLINGEPVPECPCDEPPVTPTVTLVSGYGPLSYPGGAYPIFAFRGKDGSGHDIWDTYGPLNNDGNYQIYARTADGEPVDFHVYSVEVTAGSVSSWFNNYRTGGPFITVDPTGEDVSSINNVGYTGAITLRVVVGPALE